MKMNILYFPYEYPPFIVGGLGTYAFEMTKQFTKMGQRVTVFAKNPGNATTEDFLNGVEVHRPLLADVTDLLPLIVPEDVARWSTTAQNYFAEMFLYNILSATKTINSLVKNDKRSFDVIAAHDWLDAIAGITCKKALKKPLIFHFHSTEHGRTGNGSPIVKNLERIAGKIADTIVTVSYAMRDELISLGHEEKKIEVVPNGVDEKKYDPNNEKFSNQKVQEFRERIGVKDDPMIFFVGRLTSVKGVDTLVQAMPIILRDVPNAKLVILGKGEQEDMIKHMITNLNIRNNVITHFDFVNEEERLLHYAACDVAVFPSKYEPFGLVCTEAMSMGKPVVVGARGTSGFREQIVPNGPDRCGSHANPYDPHDIAKFTIEFLKNEEFRIKCGQNARKRVLSNYTMEKVAAETLDIYKEVAGITD